MRKVIVLGASLKVYRYSFQAIHRLMEEGYKVYPIGLREGKIGNVEIITKPKYIAGIDTVLVYLNAANQQKYYDFIFELNPRRLVFNPGAENCELANLAAMRGITVVNECALVMLDLEEF